jgi:hypothetical protein
MKNTILIFTLSFISIGLLAQKNVNKDPNWEVGEVKIFNENKIKRAEGANHKETITNITYQTLKQLIEKVNSGNLRGDAKKNQIKKFKEYAPGGMIIFYINRPTSEEANLKNYTLTIKDNTGKEIYKRTYKDKVPKANSKEGGFYISTNLQIKYKINQPFIVEIFDGKTLYKFEVLE